MNSPSCRAIADLATPNFVIEKAEIVPSGPAPAPDGSGDVNNTGELLPEHYLIQGMLNPRIGGGGRKYGMDGKGTRAGSNQGNRYFVPGGYKTALSIPSVGTLQRWRRE
jgi:hypothetical protein